MGRMLLPEESDRLKLSCTSQRISALSLLASRRLLDSIRRVTIYDRLHYYPTYWVSVGLIKVNMCDDCCSLKLQGIDEG